MKSSALTGKREKRMACGVAGAAALLSLIVHVAPASGQAKPPPAAAGPVIVMETAKGTFAFETYPEDAPRSVEQILRLVKRNFYRGQRIHRVEPKSIVQWGDTQSRDMSKREWWGRGGGSGTPVGVAEFSKRRTHVRGAVGMAHAGDPREADTQLYIVLRNRPDLDGKFTVVGRVTTGIEVVDKLEVTDVIKNVTVK